MSFVRALLFRGFSLFVLNWLIYVFKIQSKGLGNHIWLDAFCSLCVSLLCSFSSSTSYFLPGWNLNRFCIKNRRCICWWRGCLSLSVLALVTTPSTRLAISRTWVILICMEDARVFRFVRLLYFKSGGLWLWNLVDRDVFVDSSLCLH